MWFRHVVKQALCAVRIHRTTSTIIAQNATHSCRQNTRFYGRASSDEIDMLFNLGRDKSKIKNQQPKYQKTSDSKQRRTTNGVSLNERDEADILDAINFNPKTFAGKSKKSNRASSENDKLAEAQRAKAERKRLRDEAPTFEELTIDDANLNLSYVKLPMEHPQLQSLMLMTRSKSHRAQKHLLLIEGRRLIEDAVDAGLPLKHIFFNRVDKLESIKDLLHNKCSDAMPRIFRVPQHDLTFWSVMTTCPGLIAIFEKFDDMSQIWERARTGNIQTNAEDISNETQITVICDQIREPNNLGSIIRTCAALPCSQVILTKGCTDPWETKALRGGCGGQFRVPVLGPMDWNSLPSFLPLENEYSVFVAYHKLENEKFKSMPYTDVPFVRCNHVVLIIGGETEGISENAIKFMSERNPETKANEDELSTPHNSCIHIPLSNGVESLNSNAAAAIMLFEIRKQLMGN